MRPTHSWLHDRQRRISRGVPGAGLGGEVRVGDLAAHHAHQVAVALGQGPLGLQRVLEPADADDRQVDRAADRGGDEQRVARRDAMDASIMYSVAVATPIEVLM